TSFDSAVARYLQARRAYPVRSRHQRTERIFSRRIVQGQSPMFNRPQSNRQGGCGRKRARVIAINGRSGKFFDELLVTKLHESQAYLFAIQLSKFIATRVLSGIAQ